MRGFIFISKRSFAFLLVGLLFLQAGLAPLAHAQGKTDKSLQPEEDDYSNTPFTQYGEFNGDKDEEEDTKFFQAGRFFGVSAGLGFETASGNLGALYSGGFPLIDLKVHYWFDFNFALDVGFSSVNFNYVNTNTQNVNIIRVGVDLRYYFDVRNVTAAISFANPYILIGAGDYTKNETDAITQVTNNFSSFGFCAGGGLEFALKPKKAYFQVEGKVHFVNFSDTQSATGGLPNQTGQFYSLTGNFMWTW